MTEETNTLEITIPTVHEAYFSTPNWKKGVHLTLIDADDIEDGVYEVTEVMYQNEHNTHLRIKKVEAHK